MFVNFMIHNKNICTCRACLYPVEFVNLCSCGCVCVCSQSLVSVSTARGTSENWFSEIYKAVELFTTVQTVQTVYSTGK